MPAPESTPLRAPLPGASFGHALARFVRKYAAFSGRASRSEYWWAVLGSTIVYVALGVLTIVLNVTSDAAQIGWVLLGVWTLVTLIPGLAVTVRRLHDANVSGWLILLNLVPSVGTMIGLILVLLPSNHDGSRFDRQRD